LTQDIRASLVGNPRVQASQMPVPGGKAYSRVNKELKLFTTALKEYYSHIGPIHKKIAIITEDLAKNMQTISDNIKTLCETFDDYRDVQLLFNRRVYFGKNEESPKTIQHIKEFIMGWDQELQMRSRTLSSIMKTSFNVIRKEIPPMLNVIVI